MNVCVWSGVFSSVDVKSELRLKMLNCFTIPNCNGTWNEKLMKAILIFTYIECTYKDENSFFVNFEFTLKAILKAQTKKSKS